MTSSWLRRTARLSGKASLQVGVAGQVGRPAGWGGWQQRQAAGLEGGQAWWDGGPDLRSKECSGVNIVTLRSISNHFIEYSTLCRKSAFLLTIKISSYLLSTQAAYPIFFCSRKLVGKFQ